MITTVINLDKLISLLKSVKSITGRTKFQKMIFILQNKGLIFPEKFKYHYYGPYSSELQLEIDELVDRRIFNENGEGFSFKYEFNDEFANHVDNNSEISSNLLLINFLVNQDYQDLELVSTIYYLKNSGYQNDNMIKGKLKILKPHLSSKVENSFVLYNEIETKFSKN